MTVSWPAGSGYVAACSCEIIAKPARQAASRSTLDRYRFFIAASSPMGSLRQLRAQQVGDLRRHALARLDRPNADSVAEGQRVGAAVAFDDDSAQPDHARAVIGARIELAAQGAQHRPRCRSAYVA